MSQSKKAIDMTPEELEQWLDQLEIEDDEISGSHFSDPDPYFKLIPSTEQNYRNFRFGEDGHIRVKNLSAFWLPEFTLQKEIGGTLYSVSGSYEGTECLHKKLERIVTQNTENTEDTE